MTIVTSPGYQLNRSLKLVDLKYITNIKRGRDMVFSPKSVRSETFGDSELFYFKIEMGLYLKFSDYFNFTFCKIYEIG